ncbi:MAG TPA: hypothetical protein VLG92_05345 [Candidatus Saccharimonadia bacterium]|nr:hypothetical protein [Candidatus Saccharimonadia bacterium]
MSEHIPRSPVAYPEEDFLRTDSMTASASIQDPSALYPELARTHGALYTQQYLHEGSEQSLAELAALQPDQQRLTPGAYQELHEFSRYAMPDQESYAAVEYINTIHDICKNPEIMRAVGLEPGNDSHDEGLRRLFLPEYGAVRRHFLPSYDNPEIFTDNQRRLIQGVLTAPFNFIRFVQSQASEYEIESLATMPQPILAAAIAHGIHDLGGAMGHKNERASLTLDEPAAVRLLDAAYSLTGNAADFGFPESTDTPITPRLRQQVYMSLRAARLGITATDGSQTSSAELLTKLAVADLLRAYGSEEFVAPQTAFDRLPETLRITWSTIHALPLHSPKDSGRFEGQGTEYAPAFLRALGKDVDSYYTMLGYFAQLYKIAYAVPTQEAGRDGLTSFPTQSPYRILNLYHLATWFTGNAEQAKTATSIWVRMIATGDTLTPHVLPEADHSDPIYAYPLLHPDHLEESAP